jgi:hypothetical protein
MNVIYIVVVNDKIDEVFSSREAAELHIKNQRWSICKIVEKEIKEL